MTRPSGGRVKRHIVASSNDVCCDVLLNNGVMAKEFLDESCMPSLFVLEVGKEL